MTVERFGIRDTRDTKGQGYGIPNEFSGLRDTRVTGYRTTIFMVTGYGLRVAERLFSWLRVTGYGLPKGYHHNLHANPGVRV